MDDIPLPDDSPRLNEEDCNDLMQVEEEIIITRVDDEDFSQETVYSQGDDISGDEIPDEEITDEYYIDNTDACLPKYGELANFDDSSITTKTEARVGVTTSECRKEILNSLEVAKAMNGAATKSAFPTVPLPIADLPTIPLPADKPPCTVPKPAGAHCEPTVHINEDDIPLPKGEPSHPVEGALPPSLPDLANVPLPPVNFGTGNTFQSQTAFVPPLPPGNPPISYQSYQSYPPTGNQYPSPYYDSNYAAYQQRGNYGNFYQMSQSIGYNATSSAPPLPDSAPPNDFKTRPQPPLPQSGYETTQDINRYSPSVPMEEEDQLIIRPGVMDDVNMMRNRPMHSVLGKAQAKKRLLAFQLSKQAATAHAKKQAAEKKQDNNGAEMEAEGSDSSQADKTSSTENADEKVKKKGVKKPPKVEKARETIEEIEEIKRSEMMLRDNPVNYRKFDDMTSNTVSTIYDDRRGRYSRSRSRSRSRTRSGTRSRSGSHGKYKRSSRRGSRSRSHSYRDKPKVRACDVKSWGEFNESGYRLERYRRQKLKENVDCLISEKERRKREYDKRSHRRRSRSRKSVSIEKEIWEENRIRKVNVFENASEIRIPVLVSGVQPTVAEDPNEYPSFIMRYTNTKPMLRYSENPTYANLHLMSLSETLGTMPDNIKDIATNFLNSITPKRLKEKKVVTEEEDRPLWLENILESECYEKHSEYEIEQVEAQEEGLLSQDATGGNQNVSKQLIDEDALRKTVKSKWDSDYEDDNNEVNNIRPSKYDKKDSKDKAKSSRFPAYSHDSYNGRKVEPYETTKEILVEPVEVYGPKIPTEEERRYDEEKENYELIIKQEEKREEDNRKIEMENKKEEEKRREEEKRLEEENRRKEELKQEEEKRREEEKNERERLLNEKKQLLREKIRNEEKFLRENIKEKVETKRNGNAEDMTQAPPSDNQNKLVSEYEEFLKMVSVPSKKGTSDPEPNTSYNANEKKKGDLSLYSPESCDTDEGEMEDKTTESISPEKIVPDDKSTKNKRKLSDESETKKKKKKKSEKKMKHKKHGKKMKRKKKKRKYLVESSSSSSSCEESSSSSDESNSSSSDNSSKTLSPPQKKDKKKNLKKTKERKTKKKKKKHETSDESDLDDKVSKKKKGKKKDKKKNESDIETGERPEEKDEDEEHKKKHHKDKSKKKKKKRNSESPAKDKEKPKESKKRKHKKSDDEDSEIKSKRSKHKSEKHTKEKSKKFFLKDLNDWNTLSEASTSDDSMRDQLTDQHATQNELQICTQTKTVDKISKNSEEHLISSDTTGMDCSNTSPTPRTQNYLIHKSTLDSPSWFQGDSTEYSPFRQKQIQDMQQQSNENGGIYSEDSLDSAGAQWRTLEEKKDDSFLTNLKQARKERWKMMEMSKGERYSPTDVIYEEKSPCGYSQEALDSNCSLEATLDTNGSREGSTMMMDISPNSSSCPMPVPPPDIVNVSMELSTPPSEKRNFAEFGLIVDDASNIEYPIAKFEIKPIKKILANVFSSFDAEEEYANLEAPLQSDQHDQTKQVNDSIIMNMHEDSIAQFPSDTDTNHVAHNDELSSSLNGNEKENVPKEVESKHESRMEERSEESNRKVERSGRSKRSSSRDRRSSKDRRSYRHDSRHRDRNYDSRDHRSRHRRSRSRDRYRRGYDDYRRNHSSRRTRSPSRDRRKVRSYHSNTEERECRSKYEDDRSRKESADILRNSQTTQFSNGAENMVNTSQHNAIASTEKTSPDDLRSLLSNVRGEDMKQLKTLQTLLSVIEMSDDTENNKKDDNVTLPFDVAPSDLQKVISLCQKLQNNINPNDDKVTDKNVSPQDEKNESGKADIESSPKRLPLDERLELELGIKKKTNKHKPPPAPPMYPPPGNQSFYQVQMYDGNMVHIPQQQVFCHPPPTTGFHSGFYTTQQVPNWSTAPPFIHQQMPPFSTSMNIQHTAGLVPGMTTDMVNANSVHSIQVGNVLQIVPKEVQAHGQPPLPPDSAPSPIPHDRKEIECNIVLRQQLIGNTADVMLDNTTKTTICNNLQSVIPTSFAAAPAVSGVNSQDTTSNNAALEASLAKKKLRGLEKKKKKQEKVLLKLLKVKAAIKARAAVSNVLPKSMSQNEKNEEVESADVKLPPIPLGEPAKGILISPGFKEKSSPITQFGKTVLAVDSKKCVSFADGIKPGLDEEAVARKESYRACSPPPPLTGHGDQKKRKKKKVKVKVVKKDEESDDDELPPPPPPSAPPPPMYVPTNVFQTAPPPGYVIPHPS